MIDFFKKYWKQVLGVILGVILLYFIIYLVTPKPQMSELDVYKLEKLEKNINLILDNQKKLDKQIDGYQKELSNIDSLISKIKNQKIIIKEYYKKQGENIKKMNPNEIDSLFRKRYKY